MTHQALSGQEAGHAGSSTGVAIVHGGRRVRLKWHRLRRRRRDPLFDAETLAEGLRLGASMEVDLRVTRDGDFAVLHDGTLDRETDGTGAVVECTGEEIRALHYRSAGAPRPVLLASDLAQALGPGHPEALLQLDMKDDVSAVGQTGVERLATFFAGCEGKLVVSGDSTELTLAISERLPGIERGLEPSFRLLDLYRAGRKSDLAGQLVQELKGPIRPHIVYLSWELVLPAKADGIDLIGICHDHGALVDAWTFNPANPEAGFSDEEWEKFSALLELGADQITTDEAIATERAYRARVQAG
jgi:Glycerophosphoryl diester phosphodiesterase